MQLITNNTNFLADYQQLQKISLNPERHTARNAYEHCEMVVDRIKQLAKVNHCLEEETAILVNLAFLHDIGKTTGTAKPEKSVELLPRYGEFDESFVSLIKYHDINLPWYISYTKGEAPTVKAWQKLSRRVDIKLLCIFMVADRVDCPGGWTKNKALMWFLGQCRERGYLSQELKIEEG
jgi:hypothetical protein